MCASKSQFEHLKTAKALSLSAGFIAYMAALQRGQRFSAESLNDWPSEKTFERSVFKFFVDS